MSLDTGIEALLFYKAEPMKKAALAAFFEVSEEEISAAATTLRERLTSGATRLSVTETELELVTAPEYSEVIQKLRKDDLKKDIGKAGAETLAIILYRGPISRVEIDKIRGVNSNFILRNLLMRGLIEKRDQDSASRSFTYAITPALMNHLGITAREELPDFEEILNTLDTYDREQLTEIS